MCLSEAPPPGKREEQLGIFFVTDHETHIIKIFFRICHRIYHVRKVPLRLMFQISHSQFHYWDLTIHTLSQKCPWAILSRRWVSNPRRFSWLPMNDRNSSALWSELSFLPIQEVKIRSLFLLSCSLQSNRRFLPRVEKKRVQQLRNLSKRPFRCDSDLFLDATSIFS